MRVSNDQSQAAQHIERFLENNPNGHIYVATGFASPNGLAWLHRRTRHRAVTVVIGGSSLDVKYWKKGRKKVKDEAREFLDRSDVSVCVGKGSHLASELHAKMWITKSDAGLDVLVGSANLTKNGLHKNREAMTRARDEDRDRHWNDMRSHVEWSHDAKNDIWRLMQRESSGGKTSRNRASSTQGSNHRGSRWARASSVGSTEIERSHGDTNNHRPSRAPEPAITPRSASAPAISRPRRPEPLLSTDPDPWQSVQVPELQPAPRRRTGRRWAAVLLAGVAALAVWWWMTGGISAQQSFSTAGRYNRPAPASVSADRLRDLADKPCPQWTADDVSLSSRALGGFDWGNRDGDGDGRPCETRTPDGISEKPCDQWTAADRSIADVAPVEFDWGDRDSDGDGRPCEASAVGG